MIKPEVSDSWKRKIWTHSIPFSFETGVMTIPEDWDRIEGKYEPAHIYVVFQLVGTKESKNMAIWADDNIGGYFTYRDWTKSSLPYVDEMETYWSGFTFQKLEDAKKFVEEFDGSGNWMEGHKEFIDDIDKKRNG